MKRIFSFYIMFTKFDKIYREMLQKFREYFNELYKPANLELNRLILIT